MRYFHRTTVSIEDVLAEADRHFVHLAPARAESHRRTFEGSIGAIEVRVRAEGGHYTLIDVSTDQVGESEADKLARRFLTLVHKRAEPDHAVRGAY